MYGIYHSFATLGSYVMGLRYSSFCEGNFLADFGRGWAETKSGLCSSSDSLVIRRSVMMWNSTFCKITFPFLLVIFLTVSGGPRQTYNCHSSFKKIFDPIPHHHTFHFVKNQEAQLWILLVLWYVYYATFLYTKMSARIVAMCGCKHLVFNH